MSKRKKNFVNNQVFNKWTIFHSNIRGYNSKKASLDKIALALAPNVLCLNEHGLRGTNKPQIKGYKSFSRNRKTQTMGGGSISDKNCQNPNSTNSSIQQSLRLDCILNQRSTTHHHPHKLSLPS